MLDVPSPSKPDPALVQQAIEIYLAHAYPDGPPMTVRSMVSTLRSYAGDFFKAPTFVKDDAKSPKKYTLRLGNQHYPHMKLVYELGPDGQTFLFRADSHDAHCCPPAGTPEHDAFVALMTSNQQTVSAIEKGWGEANLPTFKTFLKMDLAKRRAAGGAGGVSAAGGKDAAAPQGPAASTT